MANIGFAQETNRYESNVFEEITVETNIIYGKSTSQAGYTEELKMDIYYPANDTVRNRPLVILAHGGFFFFGDKEGFQEECVFLASAGYVAVSINYRLIDIDTTDKSELVSKRAVIDAVFDMKSAVRYFYKDKAEADQYKIDTSNIFIGGYSAGAITSLHYAYANTIDDVEEMGGKLMLKYIIGQGGIDGESGNPDYSTKVKGVINIAGSLHSADFVDNNEPILLSFHGTADEIVPYFSGTTGTTSVETDGSGSIHKKANKIGLINRLVTFEGGDHFTFHYGCEDCKEQMRAFLFKNL